MNKRKMSYKKVVLICIMAVLMIGVSGCGNSGDSKVLFLKSLIYQSEQTIDITYVCDKDCKKSIEAVKILDCDGIEEVTCSEPSVSKEDGVKIVSADVDFNVDESELPVEFSSIEVEWSDGSITEENIGDIIIDKSAGDADKYYTFYADSAADNSDLENTKVKEACSFDISGLEYMDKLLEQYESLEINGCSPEELKDGLDLEKGECLDVKTGEKLETAPYDNVCVALNFVSDAGKDYVIDIDYHATYEEMIDLFNKKKN